MVWKRKGLIFCPDGELSWQNNSFMTPTAWIISDEIIRLYGGFRDKEGKSRIGYIDVKASNPKEVVKICKNPVIELGDAGTFDDRGMILGDIIEESYDGKKRLRMYYVGFQFVENVKFYAFSGCAFSYDNGETFERFSKTPILDRSDEGLYIRAIHSVIHKDNKWHTWYSTCSSWIDINGIYYPEYLIRYLNSDDGLNFKPDGEIVISPNENEYRIGRPRVYLPNEDDNYIMYFTSDTFDKNYSSGSAFSKDGINWQRDNKYLSGFKKSDSGWDSQMACYPVKVNTKYGKYLFYSGNNMGQTGVGYYVWQEK